jgi:hypothetical protein
MESKRTEALYFIELTKFYTKKMAGTEFRPGGVANMPEFCPTTCNYYIFGSYIFLHIFSRLRTGIFAGMFKNVKSGKTDLFVYY